MGEIWETLQEMMKQSERDSQGIDLIKQQQKKDWIMDQAEQMHQVLNREMAKRASRRNSTSDEGDYSSKPISNANSPLRKDESASKMLQQRSNGTKSQLRYADSLSDHRAPSMTNNK